MKPKLRSKFPVTGDVHGKGISKTQRTISELNLNFINQSNLSLLFMLQISFWFHTKTLTDSSFKKS